MKHFAVLVLLAIFLAVLTASTIGAQERNFGVNPALENAKQAPASPTIATDLAKEGYVPTGPDGTLVPATVRGFDPGNGKDTSFGVVSPPSTPKVSN